MAAVITPFAVNVKARATSYRPRREDATSGIISTKIIASSPQLGPKESGSGRAKYKNAAAIMATNAGQRGSRISGLVVGFVFISVVYHIWMGNRHQARVRSTKDACRENRIQWKSSCFASPSVNAAHGA